MSRLGIVKVRLEQDVNAYLLSCSDTKEAVVVDPGEPAEKVLGQLGGLKLRWLVATHGHRGHLAGKDALKDAAGGETAMHMADAKLFLRSADRYLLDGDELEFGRFKLEVMHLPGHSPGSLGFLVGNHLFVGDTLLQGGIGKEQPGTDLRQQMVSIGTRILRLPPQTAIYPGHGPVTTLAAELQSNPIFRAR
jgi:hydroxyacylglutathione hydrolase